jgi:hypothetical protein
LKTTDDGTAPDNIQGQSFLSILKESKTQVRQLVFSEHDWHVYKNHERMVRFGDFVYVKKITQTSLTNPILNLLQGWRDEKRTPQERRPRLNSRYSRSPAPNKNCSF